MFRLVIERGLEMLLQLTSKINVYDVLFNMAKKLQHVKPSNASREDVSNFTNIGKNNGNN